MFRQKKPTYILITILVLSLLASCGRESLTVTYTGPQTGTGIGETVRTAKGTDMIGGLNYSAGRHLSYLERNRLVCETVTESDGNSYYYVLSKISGLTDNRVQSAVNDTIRDVAQNWCTERPLPAALAAKELPEDIIKNACYGASTAITLSCGDYFSGVIARTIDLYDPETQTHSLQTYDYALNFDLRSGEEFSLSALFRDGYDYMTVISQAIINYAKANGMALKNFSGIPEDNAFSLNEDGLVIYMDDSFEREGLPSGTAITIDYSAFGDSFVIERPCSDIYIDRESAGFKLIRSSKTSNVTDEKVYFDEGDKLSVKVTRTSPQDFPAELFTDADTYLAEYLPDDTAAEKIRSSESDYLRLSCDIAGYYIGNYSCVTLNCSVKKSGEAPWTSVRSFLYDESGAEVSAETLFTEEYDVNTCISGLLAASVNALMEDGWTIEEEIDVSDIDCFLDSESISFSTLPVRMTRTVTAADGSEQNESRKESIIAASSFDEIGTENLTITK